MQLTCFSGSFERELVRREGDKKPKLVGSSEFDEGWDEDGDVRGTDKMAASYWARRAVASQGGGGVEGGGGGGSFRPLHPT